MQRAPSNANSKDTSGQAEHCGLHLDQQHHAPDFQPMARRMPISLVRSNTDMAIVFAMPRIPIASAMAEVPQATACARSTN